MFCSDWQTDRQITKKSLHSKIKFQKILTLSQVNSFYFLIKVIKKIKNKLYEIYETTQFKKEKDKLQRIEYEDQQQHQWR